VNGKVTTPPVASTTYKSAATIEDSDQVRRLLVSAASCESCPLIFYSGAPILAFVRPLSLLRRSNHHRITPKGQSPHCNLECVHDLTVRMEGVV